MRTGAVFTDDKRIRRSDLCEPGAQLLWSVIGIASIKCVRPA